MKKLFLLTTALGCWNVGAVNVNPFEDQIAAHNALHSDHSARLHGHDQELTEHRQRIAENEERISGNSMSTAALQAELARQAQEVKRLGGFVSQFQATEAQLHAQISGFEKLVQQQAAQMSRLDGLVRQQARELRAANDEIQRLKASPGSIMPSISWENVETIGKSGSVAGKCLGGAYDSSRYFKGTVKCDCLIAVSAEAVPVNQLLFSINDCRLKPPVYGQGEAMYPAKAGDRIGAASSVSLRIFPLKK